MLKKTSILTFLAALLLNLASQAQQTSTFDGEIELSYSLFDQEGKRSTAEDAFNLYSGWALGNLRFNSYFADGTSLDFASSDLNRGNRALSLGLRRSTWLSLKLNHQESRFFFGDNLENSKRKSSGGSLGVSPASWLKLFADYNYQKKDGDRIALIPSERVV